MGHILRNNQQYKILLLILQGKRIMGRIHISWFKNLCDFYNKSANDLFWASYDRIGIANMNSNILTLKNV